MVPRTAFVFLVVFVLANQVGESGAKEPKSSEKDDLARKDLYGDPLPAGAVARMGTVRFRSRARIAVFSPDDKVLATLTGEWTIQFWDAQSGKPLHHISPLSSMQSLAFSPDGKTLASAGDALFLWDVNTGKKLLEIGGKKQNIFCVRFSPNGKLLACCGQDPVVRLWDATTGRQVRELVGHSADWIIEQASFSPSGETLVSASRDRTAIVWDVATGKEMRKYTGQRPHSAVAHSPDGKVVALGDWKGDVILLDEATARELRRLKKRQHPVRSLAFTPDGVALASGADDSGVLLWDLATGKERPESSDLTEDSCHVAISHDGRFLALCGMSQAIRIWDVEKRAEKKLGGGHVDFVDSVAVSPDGKLLASAGYDGTVRVWETSTGRELRKWTAHGKEAVSAVLFLPDGTTLASAGYEGTAGLWDVATGKELKRLRSDESRVFCLAASPDGKTLFTAGWFLVDVWEVGTGKRLRQLGEKPEQLEPGHGPSPLSDLIVSPDGRTVGVMYDERRRLWETSVGRELPLAGLLPDLRPPFAFSPDGRTLAGMRWPDGEKREFVFLETATGGQRLRVQSLKPGDQVNVAVFGPDGSRFASASGANVFLWDALSGELLWTFQGDGGAVTSLAFTPDGKALASGNRDSTILVWNVAGVPRKAAAGRVPDLGKSWDALAGRDCTRAYQAVKDLAGQGGSAVAFLAGKARPVRAPDARLVAWIADLDSNEYVVREKATEELGKCAEEVEGVLRRVLEGKPSPEQKRRVEHLLEEFVSERSSPSAERMRSLRSVEALEHIGTLEARRVLEILAKGAPDARLTQEAKAALTRLVRRIERP
jgi:WD40 repeat protein